jgi:polyhydroxyalkanoate synthesis regulator phasin
LRLSGALVVESEGKEQTMQRSDERKAIDEAYAQGNMTTAEYDEAVDELLEREKPAPTLVDWTLDEYDR